MKGDPMLLKKELCITKSIHAQAKIRKILQENGIAYDIRTIDRNIMLYRVAANKVSDNIYKIYVSKKEYTRAKYLIREVSLK